MIEQIQETALTIFAGTFVTVAILEIVFRGDTSFAPPPWATWAACVGIWGGLFVTVIATLVRIWA